MSELNDPEVKRMPRDKIQLWRNLNAAFRELHALMQVPEPLSNGKDGRPKNDGTAYARKLWQHLRALGDVLKKAGLSYTLLEDWWPRGGLAQHLLAYSVRPLHGGENKPGIVAETVQGELWHIVYGRGRGYSRVLRDVHLDVQQFAEYLLKESKPEPRGRKPVDVNQDDRIVAAWGTKRYREYSELALKLGVKAPDVKKAIDRHRHRKH